jgi:hypothetical protein
MSFTEKLTKAFQVDTLPNPRSNFLNINYKTDAGSLATSSQNDEIKQDSSQKKRHSALRKNRTNIIEPEPIDSKLPMLPRLDKTSNLTQSTVNKNKRSKSVPTNLRNQAHAQKSLSTQLSPKVSSHKICISKNTLCINNNK